MPLERAIEILSNNGLKPEGVTWGEYLEAVQLGIEALKWRQRMELDYGKWCGWTPLPGETKD